MASRVRRALITGASAGIGEEFARQLAARHVDLTLVARRRDRLEQLASHLRDAHGIDCEVLPADLTADADLQLVIDRVRDNANAIDLLVNNAGVGMFGPTVELDADDIATMIDLNIRAATRLLIEGLRVAHGRDRGGVLTVSSTAAFQANPQGAVYGATKAYLRSLSEAASVEAHGTGVRVSVVCPGITESEFAAVSGQDRSAMPSGLELDAATVVTQALEGYEKGHAVIVPGVVNKAGALVAAVTPSRLSRRVSGRLHRQMVDTH